MQVISRVQSFTANTDFATELMERLFALIDCCPPCGQMLKGAATPRSGRWFQSRAVTLRGLGLKMSAQICSQATQLRQGVCQRSSDTSTAAHKLGFFSH